MAEQKPNRPFQRNEEHYMPGLETGRLIAAILHLLWPFLTYLLMFHGYYESFLSQLFPVNHLTPERMMLYLSLDIFYGVRWAFGCMTMQSRNPLYWSIGFLGIFKFILHQVSYQVFSVIAFPGFLNTSPELGLIDYIAAAGCIAGGVLQHGSEAQRYFFKRKNPGKLHTTGFFAWARFINHTGHMLRDVSALLFAPANLFFWLLQLPFPFTRLQVVMKEGIEHMRKKYGKDYEEYEKKVPWLLVPGVY
ncbi:MAG: DUF1295 domain-containing protein [Pseudomonadota bacterium]